MCIIFYLFQRLILVVFSNAFLMGVGVPQESNLGLLLLVLFMYDKKNQNLALLNIEQCVKIAER